MQMCFLGKTQNKFFYLKLLNWIGALIFDCYQFTLGFKMFGLGGLFIKQNAYLCSRGQECKREGSQFFNI